jgi:hypothetical protein
LKISKKENDMNKTIATVILGCLTNFAMAQWQPIDGAATDNAAIYHLNGNVGIGTATPTYKLDIMAPVNVWKARFQGPDGYIVLGPANTDWAHIYTDRPNFIFNAGIYSTTGVYSSYSTADLTLQTSGTSRLTVANATGHVGIGTIAPAFPLDIQGSGARLRNISTASGAYSTFRMQGPDYTNGLEIDFFGNNNIASDINWSYGGGAGSAAIVNVNAKPLVFGTNNQGRMLIDGNGKVGIGTSSPSHALTISTTAQEVLRLSSASHAILDINSGTGLNSYVRFKNNETDRWDLTSETTGNLRFYSYASAQPGIRMMITPEGNVGIGTTTPGSFKLAVNGKIWTQEVNVAMTNPGPDYVFEKEYDLLSLPELEAYINQNKHLPEVPSAKEMEKDGLNLKEMNLILLKKVEELTLHLIETNKKSEEQQKRIEKTEQENASLKKRIVLLEKK